MDSIIIIGAGAAGLMAAYELSKHNKNIILLEAKNRLGGRIHTVYDPAFSQHLETGAEFIHGNLPLTFCLLKEAGIPYHTISGKMVHLKKEKNKVVKDDENDNWDEAMDEMKNLKADMPLKNFLDTFFNDDKYKALRSSVKNFAGGFDLADITTASTKSLYREWKEEWGDQYRVDGGYKLLIDYLEKQCKKNGCIINTNCCAKKISWQKNEVNIITMCSRFFKGNKLVVTVPVSVLQKNNKSEDYIEFAPAIPEHINAAKNIGFGTVIKIFLEFEESFWSKKTNDAAFIITEENISTWWTQLPVKNNLLIGWVGGEKAISLKDNTNEEILGLALQSLANTFQINIDLIKTKLKASKVSNWWKEPDINGGYSFNTIKSVDAKKVLEKPVENTIFFSGEALYQEVPIGTVEAALASGKKTAQQVLKIIK